MTRGCAHTMFACVCSHELARVRHTPTGKSEIAGRRRVYEVTDTPNATNFVATNHYTTTLLGTHYTHNTWKCAHSMHTFRGGRGE